MASAEVRDASFRFHDFALLGQNQEVSEVVKLGGLGLHAEFGATVCESRFEECPPEGQEYDPGVCVCQRGGVVSGTHQLESVFDPEALQLLADQPDAHVYLVDSRQTLEQVRECRFLLNHVTPASA